MPATEQLTRYRLFYFGKSDGKLETLNKKKKKEPNEPTAAQMNATPDKNGLVDYYRLIEIGDDKEVEWRRKLGGMIKRELEIDQVELRSK